MTINNTDDGMGTLAGGYNESYWRGNGTGRLETWTNNSSTSGFTLSGAASFSVASIQVANGYVANNKPISSITITGTFVGGQTVTHTVNSGFSDWQTVNLPNTFTGLHSVTFRANGSNNRAVWDNIDPVSYTNLTLPTIYSV